MLITKIESILWILPVDLNSYFKENGLKLINIFLSSYKTCFVLWDVQVVIFMPQRNVASKIQNAVMLFLPVFCIGLLVSLLKKYCNAQYILKWTYCGKSHFSSLLAYIFGYLECQKVNPVSSLCALCVCKHRFKRSVLILSPLLPKKGAHLNKVKVKLLWRSAIFFLASCWHYVDGGSSTQELLCCWWHRPAHIITGPGEV